MASEISPNQEQTGNLSAVASARRSQNQNHNRHGQGHQTQRQSVQLHPLFPIPVLEDIPMTNKELIMETYELEEYKVARKRIQELRSTNLTNDKITILFVGSIDSTGKIWHTDCNSVDRAVCYLLRKLEVGGFFLKIHVGGRTEWLDPNNPWRVDRTCHVTGLPTLMVCDTNQRLSGRKCFDIQSLLVLLRD